MGDVMALETTEQLTGLLSAAALKSRLAKLEGLVPGVGLALNLDLEGQEPILFANLSMPIEEDGSVANVETLAHLNIGALRLQVSILIHSPMSDLQSKRGDLVMAALQVLDYLDQEVSVPAAA